MTYVWSDLFQCNLVLVVDIPYAPRVLSVFLQSGLEKNPMGRKLFLFAEVLLNTFCSQMYLCQL